MVRRLGLLSLCGLLVAAAAAGQAPRPDADAKPPRPFGPRSLKGAERQKWVEEHGGNDASEAAVALGLAWLAKSQKADGRWVIDGAHKEDVAATALGLLPLLGAGHCHKFGVPVGNKPSPYVETARKGVAWLRSQQKAAGGSFSNNMYAHAFATLAVCEAYGMTGDPQLRGVAQAAVKFMEKSQHAGGGWRYAPGQPGDTSVTAWQVQALRAGQLAGLAVEKRVLERCDKYLDSVAIDGGA